MEVFYGESESEIMNNIVYFEINNWSLGKDYPDNPPYLDVSSIKECPQCYIPFNGKVQIKKEF